MMNHVMNHMLSHMMSHIITMITHMMIKTFAGVVPPAALSGTRRTNSHHNVS